MYKKEETIFDASVERAVSEVLRWLADDNPSLTISPIDDREYLLTEEDLLRDLTIFSEEVFDGETVREPSAVAVTFRNGQTFHITVKEKF